MDDEFLCLTVQSEPGEDESAFAARLSLFWTHMLRTFPDEFEGVYAETIEFESEEDCVTRQYLCLEPALDRVVEQLAAAGIKYADVDRDDRWSKYEASPSEWWQIEH